MARLHSRARGDVARRVSGDSGRVSSTRWSPSQAVSTAGGKGVGQRPDPARRWRMRPSMTCKFETPPRRRGKGELDCELML